MSRNLIKALAKILAAQSEKVTTAVLVEYDGREYEVELGAKLSFDPNYGADADNKRGVPATSLDDVWVEDITSSDDEKIEEKDRKEIERIAYKEAENINWGEFNYAAANLVLAESLEDKIVSFLKQKEHSDDDIHAFAADEGIDPHEFESIIYKIAHKALTGKYLNHGIDPDEDFDPEQLAIGEKIESEHTGNIDIAKSIAKAHLSENSAYYKILKAANL